MGSTVADAAQLLIVPKCKKPPWVSGGLAKR